MKVENERRAPVEKPKAEFKEVLKLAPKAPPKTPERAALKVQSKLKVGSTGTPLALGHRAVLSEARAHANTVVEGRAQARAGMELKVERAQEVRSDAVSSTQNKTESKALELIARELKDDKTETVRELPVVEIKAAATIQRPVSGAAAGSDAPKETKAFGIMELVERIRVFERAGRPAMAITVGGSLNAHVEIERAGPNRVALKLIGKANIPSAAALNEIKDELAKRGISVASLSVGSR